MFWRWVKATWAGWLIGVPLVALLALAGEAVGIGGSQAIVGAGMGLGVGWRQGRVVGEWGVNGRAWLWSCVVGLVLPFLVVDVANAVGWGLSYWLPVCLIVAGAITGAWQAVLLRHWGWLAASVAGWVLVAGVAAAGDWMSQARPVKGVWGALAYLAVVGSGGLMLGLATALCFAGKGFAQRNPMVAERSAGRAQLR